jgi:hypothetical protein
MLAGLLAACGPGGDLEAPELSGPVLVVEVTNRSERDVLVGYAFASNILNGSGELRSPACRREALRLGMVAGQYEVRVDGKRVTGGDIGPDLPENRDFLVMRLEIHPNGGAEIFVPDLKEQAPQTSVAISRCGDQ